jgi:hypothetical protein
MSLTAARRPVPGNEARTCLRRKLPSCTSTSGWFVTALIAISWSRLCASSSDESAGAWMS